MSPAKVGTPSLSTIAAKAAGAENLLSMTSPVDPVADLVNRTRVNLVATDQWRARDPATEFFEVTKLLNSMLGIVVVPCELGLVQHLERLIGDIHDNGIPRWHVRFVLWAGEARTPLELPALVRGLRHAVAHQYVAFYPDNREEIASLTFEKRHTRGAEGTTLTRENARLCWSIRFELPELHAFLDKLATEVIAARRRQRRQTAA